MGILAILLLLAGVGLLFCFPPVGIGLILGGVLCAILKPAPARR